MTEIISHKDKTDRLILLTWLLGAVEGSIQTNNFTDRDGNKRKSVEVVANQVSFCGSKADSQGTNPALSQPPQTYATADSSDFEEIVDDNDDLPF